nr:hypothetical protein [Tanacetum cinerariifolium]
MLMKLGIIGFVVHLVDVFLEMEILHVIRPRFPCLNSFYTFKDSGIFLDRLTLCPKCRSRDSSSQDGENATVMSFRWRECNSNELWPLHSGCNSYE